MTYLRNAEAFSCLALPAVFLLHWRRSVESVDWEMRTAALALVCFLLLQGVFYWHLKARAIVGRQPFPAYFQPLYRFFKYANVLLIVAIGAVIAAQGATAATADLLWSGGLLAFGVLEHINYYHYQLMYDTRAALAFVRRNGCLRKAALGLDLERRS
ncbi:MAG: hypothetical protein ABW069_01145 [Duganella sp.]